MGDGRVVTNVGEVQEDGDELEVVTEYVLSDSSWAPNELDREEPPLAVEVEGAHAAVQVFSEGSPAEGLERFETFSFDPDVLMAAYEGGMMPPRTLRSEA